MNDMNSTEAARPRAISSDWHRVGAGLSVRFSHKGDERLDAEWTPRVPTKREWKRIMDRYCGARNKFAQFLAKQRGVSVLILEAPL